MNPDQLRTMLQDRMNEAKEATTADGSSYWYPLSIPTYGVDEVLEALDSMVSFKTSMWAKTRLFEEAFGARFGGEAVMVNSGSSADLLMAFAHLGKATSRQDERRTVLVPAVTWPTHIWSLIMAGFRVRLVDVDTRTLNVRLDLLRDAVTPDVGAISLVHLMGNPVAMDEVTELCRQHNLELMEDCCESLGAAWKGQGVGTFGSMASFSFFFSHHITTMEGGMILTQDPELAEQLRLLRAHGWSRNLRRQPPAISELDPRYTFLDWGFNVRPTELQAGFGSVQLTRFDEFQRWRTANHELFAERLKTHEHNIQLMKVDEDGSCSWFALPMMLRGKFVNQKNRFAQYLEANGVETRPIVTGNVARHPAVARYDNRIEFGDLPGADQVHDSGIYIGLHPQDSEVELERVADMIDAFFAGP